MPLRADTHGRSVRHVRIDSDFRAALPAHREGQVGVAGRLRRLAAIDVFGADGSAGFAGRAIVAGNGDHHPVLDALHVFAALTSEGAAGGRRRGARLVLGVGADAVAARQLALLTEAEVVDEGFAVEAARARAVAGAAVGTCTAAGAVDGVLRFAGRELWVHGDLDAIFEFRAVAIGNSAGFLVCGAARCAARVSAEAARIRAVVAVEIGALEGGRFPRRCQVQGGAFGPTGALDGSAARMRGEESRIGASKAPAAPKQET